MPASMISEVAGSRLSVIGRSMAMVAVGPMPGSTPTSVPSRQPRKQKAMLCGCSATDRPSPRLAIKSISAHPEDRPRPRLDPGAEQPERQAEAEIEHGYAEHGEPDRQGNCGEQR